MSTFPIHPWERFSGPSKPIRRPVEITSFSFDEQHLLQLDDSSLRYYYPPKLGADLSKGFDTFDKHDDSADGHLDAMLASVEALERRQQSRVEADVLTWRGMGTKLMTAPFEGRDGFEMNATLFQGTLFIEENHQYKIDRQKAQDRQPSRGNNNQQVMSFWGYKFETLCLLPDTWDATSREYIENRDDERVSNKAQYCSIVKTGFTDTKLILGGEVDAIWDAKPEIPNVAPINYVELKTSLLPQKPQDFVTFERKLCKFWAQSFLLGVPRIIVGFRTRDGVLRSLEELNTVKLPGRVKKTAAEQRRRAEWDGDVCTNFLEAVLTWLKQSIATDGGVWRIKRAENDSVISLSPVEAFETITAAGPDGVAREYPRVLSKEFVEWRLSTG